MCSQLKLINDYTVLINDLTLAISFITGLLFSKKVDDSY